MWCHNHLANKCQFKDATCRNCNKKRHIAKVCHSRVPVPRHQTSTEQRHPGGRQQPARQTHHLDANADPVSNEIAGLYEMLFERNSGQTISRNSTAQQMQPALEMEIDTGASLSIISEKTYHSLWTTESQPKLQPSTVKLHTYTKEAITVLGSITVEVCYKDQTKTLSLLVVTG